MKKLDPTDPLTRSADLLAENLCRLGELFPEAMVEGKVDFQVLRQLLGDALDDREENYGLNWHGKRQARHLALTPSTGTLRPCPEDSVDWDKTQNVMIEGDNLEVLKLLQKSYAGKVKLIYIDPPYNTGKDFVYPDDYQDNIKNYLERTGQVDSEGRKNTSNTEASGRFHTDWLNMVYPRLKLARNLLREDGILIASIDDAEIGDLALVVNEVFGEENAPATLVWDRNRLGDDWPAVAARMRSFFNALPADDPRKPLGRYTKVDERGPHRTDGDPSWPGSGGPRYQVLHPITGNPVPIPKTGWRFPTVERFWEEYRSGRIVFGPDESTVPGRRRDLFSNAVQVMRSVTYSYAQTSANEFDSLFEGQRVFDNPKPVSDLQALVGYLTSPRDDLVLDFFAGSGTTGHAVMAQNATDTGHRRYILVQLPEPVDPDNKDQKAAADFCNNLGKPRNIAELTKERLRRAGRKIKDDNPLFAGDLGFPVFKLDSSNIRAWDPTTKDVERTLLDAVTNLKPDRSEADILYELLLKLGLDLAVPIEKRSLGGKTVHSIGAGVRLACLDARIEAGDVEALAQGIIEWHKALAPVGDTTCVFRDSAFADDVAKTNLTAILEQYRDDEGHACISKMRSL